MSGMVSIRYQTPQGVLGVWAVNETLLTDTSEAGCRAYLRHWHPDYTYLGRETAPRVTSTQEDTDGDGA